MKDGSDPFETLRRINPVDSSTLPDPGRSQEALDVMERIMRGDIAPPAARRFGRTRSLLRTRRGRVYLIPIVAAAALAAAALAWALTRGPTQHLDIGCYATINLQGRAAVVPATEEPPIETCKKFWLTGAFGKPPAPLEACVLPSGAVGVFPSPEGNSCERLSLTPVPADSEPPSSSVELQDTLVDRFLDRCLTEPTARRIIKKELTRLSLPDWRVATSGRFTHTRPCASLAFDEKQRQVILVPIPR